MIDDPQAEFDARAEPALPQTKRSSRRTALLTSCAVLVALVIVGGGVGAYLAYDRKAESAKHARARIVALEAERSAEYLRGLREGREKEREFAREIGLDYDAGYNDAFAGFGEWQADAYYFVQIIKGEGDLKYEIASRGRFEPCTHYLVRGDSIWTQNAPC